MQSASTYSAQESREHKALALCSSSALAWDLKAIFNDANFHANSASSLTELKRKITGIDVIVMQLILDDADGIEVIRYLGQQIHQPELIFISDLDTRIVSAARRLAISKGLNVRAILPLNVKRQKIISALTQEKNHAERKTRSPIILNDHQHLRRGLACDEFAVHFQPKIDVQSLALASVEALTRWYHPTYGVLGPNSFISLAEKTGLIAPLTDIIIEKSFRHAANWRDNGIPLKIAVNVSGASLADLMLPDNLCEMAKKHELSPENIVIEITESWVVKNTIDALDVLTRLRMKGFNLSIDDFGTGYSTMLKLKQIPFSELKLDQSIIRGAVSDSDSRAIVETSIEMGQRLGLHLVAEGVEVQDDWDLISELGCNEGQGYFIARPMKPEDLPDWLNRWNLSLGIR